MQGLFHNVVPLTLSQHGSMCIETGTGYEFAKEMSVVPVLMGELPRAVFHYPIAFMERDGKFAAVALLGLQENQNVFVGSDGKWSAPYVPAMLRHYPFAVALGPEDDAKGILCISMDHPGLNEDGKGVAFFGKDGELSKFTKEAQESITSLAIDARKTKAFCAAMKEHNLLKPMSALLKNTSGKEWRISGIQAVDRNALAELSAEALHALNADGYLEPVYQHLISLQNLRALAERATGLAGD